MLDINSRSRINSEVPMYLSLGLMRCCRFVSASLPNMINMLLENDEKRQCNHLIEACMVYTPSCSATILNKSFLNSVPLSVSSSLYTPNGNEI